MDTIISFIFINIKLLRIKVQQNYNLEEIKNYLNYFKNL